MESHPEFFTLAEIEGVPELTLGTADFVSRPIIVLAQDQIIEYVDREQPKRLIINFKNVSHISSEFINAMIDVRDHMKANEGVMKFSHMNDTVQMPFKITKLAGRLFMIYETSAEAVDAF